MKITKEMIAERKALLDKYINAYNDCIKQLKLYVNRSIDMEKEFQYSAKILNEQVAFSNSIDGKDKYVFMDALTNYIKQLIIYLNNTNNKDKEKLKMIVKELYKAANRLRKTRRKIEKHYEDDDDDEEFFNMAVWLD